MNLNKLLLPKKVNFHFIFFFKKTKDLIIFFFFFQKAKINALFESSEGPWDYVFNLAGETKYSQTEAVYKENVLDVAVKCATAAAKHGVKRFIEVSTAQVYESGKKPSKETDKLDPWTNLAKAKLAAEKAIASIQGYIFLKRKFTQCM